MAARVTARGGRPLSITRPAATTMLHSGAAALLIALSLAGRVAADEDDDDGGGAPSALQAFVDTNPSQNSTDDSSCMIGTFGYGAVGGGGQGGLRRRRRVHGLQGRPDDRGLERAANRRDGMHGARRRRGRRGQRRLGSVPRGLQEHMRRHLPRVMRLDSCVGHLRP